ncbi:MAG: phosphoribosylanthranilate isomerase [Pseudomonadota bacterium]|nr:phosphoribosylanthranilate isomerase [Pseudomonadota bacterium]
MISRQILKFKVKLCGLKDKDSIIAASNADYIGFVFYQKSPRFINAIEAKKLKKFVNSNQKLVGLFVNADINLVSHITEDIKLDIIQLHGNEDINYIKKVKKLNKPIIKAISVKDCNDINYSKEFESFCDMILFDTKSNLNISGGSGISFNWNLLRNYEPKKEWILAGGLNIKNISKALRITRAPIIDVSSGIEKSRGVKCIYKIKKFMKFVKEYGEKEN